MNVEGNATDIEAARFGVLVPEPRKNSKALDSVLIARVEQ